MSDESAGHPCPPADSIDDVPAALGGRAYLDDADPDFGAAFRAFSAAAMERADSVIPVKWQQLILLAVHASQLTWVPVAGHIQTTLDAGATPQEILQTLELVAAGRAGPVLYLATAALGDELARRGMDRRASGPGRPPGQTHA